jgi:hypothetical protein
MDQKQFFKGNLDKSNRNKREIKKEAIKNLRNLNNFIDIQR